MPFLPLPGATLAASRAAGPSAHVTATLADRFIEFEFVLGDPDLAVELVLTGDQFAEFCHLQRVTVPFPAIAC